MPDFSPNFAGVVEALRTIIQNGIPGSGGGGGSGGGTSDATAANQVIANQKLTSIDGKTTADPATATKQEAQTTSLNVLANSVGTDITGTVIPEGGNGFRGLISWLAKLTGEISSKLPSALLGDRLKTQTVLDSLTVTGSGAALNALAIPSTDLSNYTFLSLQVTGTFSATITFQFSNDNVNWNTGHLYPGGSNGLALNSSSANGIFYGNKQGRYFRAILSSYASGTVNTTLSLSTAPTVPAFQTVVQSGVSTVNVNNSIDTELPTPLTFNDANTISSATYLFSMGLLWHNQTGTNVRARSAGAAGTFGVGRAAVATGTSAVTLGTSTGTGVGPATDLSSAYKTGTFQLVINSGSLSTINCIIEGSLNGTKWFTLATITNVTDGSQVSSDGICFIFLRINVTALTGTAPNVTILAGVVA